MRIEKKCGMVIVSGSILPFPGFTAMTVYPFIFARREMDDVCLRHEAIHAMQQRELLLLPFFIIYVLEWLVRLAVCRDSRRAYRSVSFEREAYGHQMEVGYRRRRFAMWRKGDS